MNTNSNRNTMLLFTLICALAAHQIGQCRAAVMHRKIAAPQRRRNRTIVVNKADNMLKLFITGQPDRHWRVATGKYKCTPEGTFRIIEKSYVSRSGDDPLGTRWLGLNTLGRRHRLRVGIHGTNDPKSIGHWASLACIRMRNEDVNYLYQLVPVGTTVKVVDIPQDRPTASTIQNRQVKQMLVASHVSFHR